jgi:hypothetical protein
MMLVIAGFRFVIGVYIVFMLEGKTSDFNPAMVIHFSNHRQSFFDQLCLSWGSYNGRELLLYR